MSIADRYGAMEARIEHGARWVVRAVFGDRTGVTLFFGALSFFMLYWRVDVFIVDTFIIADTLVALSRGSVAIDTIVFTPTSRRPPGMSRHAGDLYGRNYGLATLALPVYFAFRSATMVVAPRVLIAGLWSLSVLGTVLSLGRLTAHRRTAVVGGTTVAVALFALNVVLASPLPRWQLPLVALQSTTMVGAALLGVVTYRLLRRAYGYRVGLFGGVAVLVLGPIGFWASIPKRHVPVALAVMATMYLYYRQREAEALDVSRRFRAALYVPVGIAAWFSAPEGVVLLVAVGTSDLATARSNTPRDLLPVAVALTVSLLPFFLTNVAISGNPLRPPFMLEAADAMTAESIATEAGGSSSGQPTASGGTSAESIPTETGGSSSGQSTASGGRDSTPHVVVASLLAGISLFVDAVSAGLSAFEPGRIYHVFVRSGRIPGVEYAQTGGERVDMALLEVAPLLGALLVVPVHLWRSGRSVTRYVGASRQDPVIATDLFAVAYVALLTVIYLPRLPLHSTITVRYLIPATPVLVWGVLRLPAVRATVSQSGNRLGIATAAVGLAAVALPVMAFGGTSAGVGTVIQTVAVGNLVVAAAVAAGTYVESDTRSPGVIGPVVLGAALATMAAFVLLSGLEYFGHGRAFALPLAHVLEEVIPIR